MDFLTEVTENEPEESGNLIQEKSKRAIAEAECEPEILLPLIVFLFNAMVNRKDLRAIFI